MLTCQRLAMLFPAALPGHVGAIAQTGGVTLTRHGIAGQTLRLHHFLAQVGHESAGLSRLEENLHYTGQRICAVWPTRFAGPEVAEPYAGNPRALANRVYGGRMGNGGETTGDGWRFRGRGYIQITGRAAYRAIGRRAGLDLEAFPDLAASPDHALAVACAFWSWRGLNDLCDRDDLVALTRRINGGTHGLADRRAWLDKVRRVLGEGDAVMPEAAVIVALQRALQDARYAECGAADGLAGPRTHAAIARFRAERVLAGHGIDAALLDALGLEA